MEVKISGKGPTAGRFNKSATTKKRTGLAYTIMSLSIGTFFLFVHFISIHIFLLHSVIIKLFLLQICLQSLCQWLALKRIFTEQCIDCNASVFPISSKCTKMKSVYRGYDRCYVTPSVSPAVFCLWSPGKAAWLSHKGGSFQSFAAINQIKTKWSESLSSVKCFRWGNCTGISNNITARGSSGRSPDWLPFSQIPHN